MSQPPNGSGEVRATRFSWFVRARSAVAGEPSNSPDDCLRSAREYLPGERYTTYLSISRGAGWTL